MVALHLRTQELLGQSRERLSVPPHNTHATRSAWLLQILAGRHGKPVTGQDQIRQPNNGQLVVFY